jgi:D-alanyl-D-alanine carboxypeptidase
MRNSLRTPLRPSLRTSLIAAAMAVLLSACGGNDASFTVAPPPAATPAAPLSAAMVAQIDAYVLAQVDGQNIPGMAVLVTRSGKPVLQKGYGKANLATGAAVTPDTVFRIGSVTKQFTASAIMLLVQDGRLTLDQPVSRFLPTAPAHWKEITIRHLLNHTSGLQRDLSPEFLGRVDDEHLQSIDQLIALAGETPLDYPTGSAHAYSNVGYHLLGFVIEKVTGQYYADFLRQRIFGPLGMASADVIRTTRPVPAMAAGYTWDGMSNKPASTLYMLPGLIEAEGGLQMSAVDLAKWDAALGSERLLSKASLAQMWVPSRLNDGTTVPYGFGWALAEINHRPFVHHDGLVEGFATQFTRYANEGFSVIVMTNTDSVVPEQVASRIGAILDPRLDWVVGTDPQPQTGILLRTVVDESARGVLQPDQRFAPAFQAALTPEVLQSFSAYLGQLGPIEQFGYIDQTSRNGMQVARYLVRAKYGTVVLGIALDAQGRIAVLDVAG